MSRETPPMGVLATAQAIARGEQSAEAATRAALDAADAHADLGAFVELDADGALETARAVDAARARGEALGPLAGVPISLKDNIAARDWALSAGSRMLAGYRSPFDATVTERLRAAGAVLLGRVNMDEFGMGSATTTGVAGPARNPWDAERVAGGSSGGSAVAVAIGAGAASLGTDTGGSVRLPAALCGVVGLKPTYGRVSRYGVVAYASSLEQVGVLARDVDGAAAVLAAISGACPLDATAAPLPPFSPRSSDGADAAGLRIGVPEGFVDKARAADPAVAEAIDAALAGLRDAGATLVPVRLEELDAAVAAYYVIATAEASTNLSRYDGVRYGHRTSETGLGLGELIARSRTESFGDEVQRRILLGTFALSAGYHDAFYARAGQVRRKLANAVAGAWDDCDVLAMPTSPVRAWRLDQRFDDPTAVYAMDVFTVLANLCGLPALSVPVRTAGDAMPIGLQFMAPAFEEATLVRAGRAVQAWRGALPMPTGGPR